MLPATELAALQAVAAASLDIPCTVQRKQPVRDAYAGQSDGYQTISATGLLCGLAQPSAQLMQNYDFLIGNQISWLVRLPAGQDVARDDQLLLGGATPQTLRVQAVLTPRSYATSTRVLASEIR